MTERLQTQPEDFAEVPELTAEPEREGRLMRAARWIAKGFEPIEGEHCIGVSGMGFVAIIPKEAPTGPDVLPSVYESTTAQTSQPEMPKGRPPVPTNEIEDPLSPNDDDDEEGDTSWGKLYRLGKKKKNRR